MLEAILSSDNLKTARTEVANSKSACGIDGMTAKQLLPFLKKNGRALRRSILDGKYIPQPVIAMKFDDKTITLGVPAVIDRFIQRAAAQVLKPLYDAQFSEYEHRFRIERGLGGKMIKYLKYFNDGFIWTARIDLCSFFESVCREKLLQILSRYIYDERVLNLLGAYINAEMIDMIEYGKPLHSSAGIYQGGPLWPLLSDVMLNELCSELAAGGETFMRGADDIMIFCKSEASAFQALKQITPLIDENLFLRVNGGKTIISRADDINFLDHGFFMTPNGYRIKIREDFIAQMKEGVDSLSFAAGQKKP